jgi:hypothetical protein
MDNQKPKIFLSYSREDMGMAKRLYNDSKRYGLDVWLDGESILSGNRWKDTLRRDWGYWESKDESDILDDEIRK